MKVDHVLVGSLYEPQTPLFREERAGLGAVLDGSV